MLSRLLQPAARLALLCVVALLGPAGPGEATGPTDRFFLLEFGSSGTAEGQVNGPGGVATDASGHVFVADSGNHRIQMFDGDGSFIRTWGWGVQDGSSEFQVCTSGCQSGLPGAGEGQFDSPQQLSVDAAGFIYVADGANHRIQKFAPAFLEFYIGDLGSEVPQVPGPASTTSRSPSPAPLLRPAGR